MELRWSLPPSRTTPSALPLRQLRMDLCLVNCCPPCCALTEWRDWSVLSRVQAWAKYMETLCCPFNMAPLSAAPTWSKGTQSITPSRKKVAQERKAEKKREIDWAFYQKNHEKKIAQVKEHTQMIHQLSKRLARRGSDIKKTELKEKLKKREKLLKQNCRKKGRK